MTQRPCLNGFILGAAALLLAGCVTNSETNNQVSVVRLISDQPVHITVSAEVMHAAKTTGTTILALPDGKLSPAETIEQQSPADRLAALQTTVKPAVPLKASVFATLKDGPLSSAEIKALFTGLETLTEDSVGTSHKFDHNGIVHGSGAGLYGTRMGHGTMGEDSGNWIVSGKAQLCMDWFEWYSGDLTCYGVTKRGTRILLSGAQESISYQIQN